MKKPHLVTAWDWIWSLAFTLPLFCVGYLASEVFLSLGAGWAYAIMRAEQIAKEVDL